GGQGGGAPRRDRPRRHGDVRGRRLWAAGAAVARIESARSSGGRGVMKLAARIALVTGAAKGMGRDICLTLAREGANLAIAARDVGPLETLGAEIGALGRKVIVVLTDVTDEPAVERLVARARDTFGRIDILLNAPGATRPI